MAWPFTPLVTFLSKSVPKVTHTFLNALQSAQNAVARPVYLNRLSIRVESYDGANVLVYPSAVMIKDSATAEYLYIEPTGYTVTTTWPTSAWRYLYLVSTNGIASIEISATAPTSSGISTPMFKTGDETRRYLCAVRCTAGGMVDKFYMRDGVYRWCESTNRYIVGSGGGGAAGSTSYTNVSVSAHCPPHAAAIRVMGKIQNTDTAASSELLIRYGGASLTAAQSIAVNPAPTGGSVINQDHLDIALFGSTSIDWANLAATSISVTIRAAGWEE